MIQRNGLGQCLAFLASAGFEGGKLTEKAEDCADGLLYQHLGRWIVKALGLQTIIPAADRIMPGAGRSLDPLDMLIDSETTIEQSIHATAEALAFLRWARRFAESQLERTKKRQPASVGSESTNTVREDP